MFHHTSSWLHGKKVCFDKVQEEITELRDALVSKDRDQILSELADVENVIPYLSKMYSYLSPKYQIKNDLHNMDILEVIDVWLHTYNMFTRHKEHHKMCIYFDQTTHFLCYALHNVYRDFDLTNDEVEEMKGFKRQRTIKRKIAEVLCK